MKFVFHVSPSLKDKLSTQRIMWELTVGLMVVFCLGTLYYANAYGVEYAIQSILLLLCALITTLLCESIYAKIIKQDIKKYLLSSFGWVTAIILTLMVPISIPPYALIISTLFAIVFSKLLFGGFGQNIFNPAAVGRAVIFAAFTGAATDLVTSATPTTVVASTYHWLPASSEVLDSFFADFGSFGSLALGNYPGAIGETFTLAILLIGVVLAVRQVIDWRVPVVYLGAIAVFTAIVALLTGLPSYQGIPSILWYPALHLCTGGIAFGAVFMLTDPVTSPTSSSGRVLFALGAAVLTLLIRLKGNLPEGCLYSILLMNMFTPMIESALDGKQLDIKKKVWTGFVSLCLVGLGIVFYASSSLEPVTQTSATASAVIELETAERDIL